MIEETLQESRDRMGKTITALENELKRIRTGRASASILDGIKIDYYGTPTPLNQAATIAIPESRLTPSNDGKLIRIAVPPLSEQRRKELVKLVHKSCEEHKVAVRNIRRDANELIKSFKKDGDISEDDAFKAQDRIQKVTDEFIAKVDEVYKAKEKEILEF